MSFSAGVEVAASTLSAAATPFQPGVEKKAEEDKEAGELVGIWYIPPNILSRETGLFSLGTFSVFFYTFLTNFVIVRKTNVNGLLVRYRGFLYIV